jgi:hypothetical protein
MAFYEVKLNLIDNGEVLRVRFGAHAKSVYDRKRQNATNYS